MIQEFKRFITRGNVIDLAVAVIIGAAFGAVVNALVTFIINPLIAAIFGQPDISQVMTWEIRDGAVLSIGGFLQAVLNFLIVAASLFAFIKAFEKLQRAAASRRGDEPIDETPMPSDEVVLLTEIRDALRQRGGTGI